MKIYQWRYVSKGRPSSWNEVDEAHFNYLLSNDFFGEALTDFRYEGRILNVESIEYVKQ